MDRGRNCGAGCSLARMERRTPASGLPVTLALTFWACAGSFARRFEISGPPEVPDLIRDIYACVPVSTIPLLKSSQSLPPIEIISARTEASHTKSGRLVAARSKASRPTDTYSSCVASLSCPIARLALELKRLEHQPHAEALSRSCGGCEPHALAVSNSLRFNRNRQRARESYGPYDRQRCPRWSSMPRTNTSRRFGPQDTAAGLSWKVPPIQSQSLHLDPS